jgi:hypothetical protein
LCWSREYMIQILHHCDTWVLWVYFMGVRLRISWTRRTRKSTSNTSTPSSLQRYNSKARKTLRASWSLIQIFAYPLRKMRPQKAKTATTNRAPDPRSAEEGPWNIQIRSPYLRIPRQGWTRGRTRWMLARTSTETHPLRPGTSARLRHLADEVPQETPGPMGLVETTSATTSSLREAGTRIARRNPVGDGTRNVS